LALAHAGAARQAGDDRRLRTAVLGGEVVRARLAALAHRFAVDARRGELDVRDHLRAERLDEHDATMEPRPRLAVRPLDEALRAQAERDPATALAVEPAEAGLERVAAERR